MQRYFGISWSRTGTSSLYHAMNSLGFHGIHYMTMPGYVHNIGTYEFANDLPIPLFYKELDDRYPGSKFIFPDRSVDEWLVSYEKHWERTGHLTVADWHVFNKEFFGTLEFDPDVFGRRFLAHRLEVLAYFADRPQDLLVLPMPYTSESLDQLAAFTGRVPDIRSEMPWICGSYSRTNCWCPESERRD